MVMMHVSHPVQPGWQVSEATVNDVDVERLFETTTTLPEMDKSLEGYPRVPREN